MPDGAFNTMSKETKKKTEKEISDADREEEETDTEVESEEEETEEEESASDDGASEEESEEEESKEKSDSSSQDEDETDYEALDEEEKEAAKKRGKPDPTKAKERFNKKKKEHDSEEESDEDDEDRPLTVKEAREFFSGISKTTQEAQALEIARKHTSSESEAKAAVTFWRTRVIPTGDLEADVKFAIGGLNHKKTLSTNAELRRALRSKNNASKDSATAHRDGMKGVGPKMSDKDTASYKRAGFKYDPASKLFKKKLPSGKYLIKDPRTKQTYIQGAKK